MIVCSCNVLSDHDVRTAVAESGNAPRCVNEVYGCLGCSAECGRCARTIKTIIDETVGLSAKAPDEALDEACGGGCSPAERATNEDTEPAKFALTAS